MYYPKFIMNGFILSRYFSFIAISGLFVSPIIASAQQFDLSEYKVVEARELDRSLGEFSGLTWDSSNQQLLVATVKKSLFFKKAYYVMLNDKGNVQGEMIRLKNINKKARDVEGITSLGDGNFVFIEEMRELLTFAIMGKDYLEPVQTIDIGKLGIKHKEINKGPEGIAYSQDLDELRILLESKEMFILSKAGVEWKVSKICESFDKGGDWAGMSAIPGMDHWLVLSEESKKVYEIDNNCSVVDELDLSDLKSKESFSQPEGIAVDDDLNLYIVSEPGAGSKKKKSIFFKLVMD